MPVLPLQKGKVWEGMRSWGDLVKHIAEEGRADLGSARWELELGHGVQGPLSLIAGHALQLVQGRHQQLGPALQ